MVNFTRPTSVNSTMIIIIEMPPSIIDFVMKRVYFFTIGELTKRMKTFFYLLKFGLCQRPSHTYLCKLGAISHLFMQVRGHLTLILQVKCHLTKNYAN